MYKSQASKKVYAFTLTDSIAKEFDKSCAAIGLSKSSVVDRLIYAFVSKTPISVYPQSLFNADFSTAFAASSK